MRCIRVNAEEENANVVKSRTFHGVRYDLTTSKWMALVPWAFAEHPAGSGTVVKYEYQGLFYQSRTRPTRMISSRSRSTGRTPASS